MNKKDYRAYTFKDWQKESNMTFSFVLYPQFNDVDIQINNVLIGNVPVEYARKIANNLLPIAKGTNFFDFTNSQSKYSHQRICEIII